MFSRLTEVHANTLLSSPGHTRVNVATHKRAQKQVAVLFFVQQGAVLSFLCSATALQREVIFKTGVRELSHEKCECLHTSVCVCECV